jgi:hypothetical protein
VVKYHAALHEHQIDVGVAFMAYEGNTQAINANLVAHIADQTSPERDIWVSIGLSRLHEVGQPGPNVTGEPFLFLLSFER